MCGRSDNLEDQLEIWLPPKTKERPVDASGQQRVPIEPIAVEWCLKLNIISSL